MENLLTDPLERYCTRTLSTKSSLFNEKVIYPQGYNLSDEDIKSRNTISPPDTIIVADKIIPHHILVDVNQYEILLTALQDITTNAGEAAKQAYNEFSRLPKPFMNISAIRLANIMESNGITYSQYGSLRKKSNHVFNFIDLGGAPGGFSQYLMWKYPHSRGLGVSISSGLKWQCKNLHMDRLKLWTHETEKTGDLLHEWDEIGPFAAKTYGVPGRDYGLDLAIGGITPELGKDRIPKNEEFIAALVLSECIVALNSLRKGGNFILQVYDTVTEFSSDVLYLLHLVFAEVVIFRPVTVPKYSAEKYIVCKKYIGPDESANVRDVMTKNMQFINKQMSIDNITGLNINTPIRVPNRLISDKIPDGFIKYMRKINDANLNIMLGATTSILDKIINLIEGLQEIDVNDDNAVMLALDRMTHADIKSRMPVNHEYNINRALVYLNLPEVQVYSVPSYAYPAYEGDVLPTSEDEKIRLGAMTCGSLPCVKGKCPM